eukprot:2443307-Prymnesium_polylepis.1
MVSLTEAPPPNGKIARARAHGRSGTRSGRAGKPSLSRRRVLELDDETGADDRAARKDRTRARLEDRT